MTPLSLSAAVLAYLGGGVLTLTVLYVWDGVDGSRDAERSAGFAIGMLAAWPFVALALTVIFCVATSEYAWKKFKSFGRWYYETFRSLGARLRQRFTNTERGTE